MTIPSNRYKQELLTDAAKDKPLRAANIPLTISGEIRRNRRKRGTIP